MIRKMNAGYVIIFLLAAIAVILEFHPAVKAGRFFVTDEISGVRDCGCSCVLESRPFYSRINYWLWLWIVSVPVFVFSFKNNISRSRKIMTLVATILLCYGAMNLSTHLMWDIRNGPFVTSKNILDSSKCIFIS